MGHLRPLLYEQIILSIKGKIPAADWNQWAIDLPNWERTNVEEAFEGFVE
jgi:hypothetical protein